MKRLKDWYLARLRKIASEKRKEARLAPRTPKSLMDGDKLLIQEIVAQSIDDYSTRANRFLATLEAQEKAETAIERFLPWFVVLAAILLMLYGLF